MKKILSLILNIVFLSPAFSQVQINHPVILTGNGVDARFTGIQNVSNAEDAVSADYLQKDSLKFAMATGGNNNYNVTLTPAVTSLSVGMVVLFEANFSNTGAATLNVNGLSADTIKKNYNSNLDSNDIQQGQMVSVMYDGTNFQMLSQLGNNNSQAQSSSNAGSMALLYADEGTSSATGNTDAIKSYNLQANTYSKIIIESEGSMTISVNGGFTCSTTASINVAGNNLKSATFSRGVANYDTWSIPFVVKTSLMQQSSTTINISGSFSMDGGGSGTIDVTSLRIYGVY